MLCNGQQLVFNQISCDVLKSAPPSLWSSVSISSQLHAQSCQVGNLKLAMVGVLTPHKSANIKNRRPLPESWLLNCYQNTTDFISELQILLWKKHCLYVIGHIIYKLVKLKLFRNLHISLFIGMNQSLVSQKRLIQIYFNLIWVDTKIIDKTLINFSLLIEH